MQHPIICGHIHVHPSFFIIKKTELCLYSSFKILHYIYGNEDFCVYCINFLTKIIIFFGERFKFIGLQSEKEAYNKATDEGVSFELIIKMDFSSYISCI